MRRATRAAWVTATLAMALAPGASGQQVSESALKDRVAQLLERLESPKVEARAAAEKSLIELGGRALPLLPASVDAKKADLLERVERVRTTLREKDEQTNLGASRVTIKGEAIRLTEVIKDIQKQSGNVVVDLRESMGEEATNPALELDIVAKPFFEALDLVAEKAGLVVEGYNGDGTIGLKSGAMADATMPKTAKPMLVYSGPFRVQLKQLGVLRDFATGAGTATATLDVMWEPRLRPMLLGIKNEELAIVDDQGKKVSPQVNQEAGETGLQAGNCAAEVNLNLTSPERSARLLASLKVKGSVTVPSGMKTFKFPSLAAPNVNLKQGPISVTLESTEVEEQIWKVALAVTYPEGGEAFESYQQGLFNNRLWLQKPDGSRFEQNGGTNSSGNEGGKMSFEYMFVDAPGKPGDYMLVYETPAKVVPIPLEFEFKDVPLP